MVLRSVTNPISLVLFFLLPLVADENKTTISNDTFIPKVPEFSIAYLGEDLVCSPTGLIKTKTHKDLVTYDCQKHYAKDPLEIKQDDERGHAEIQRMNSDVKSKMEKGVVYSVEIPLYDANSPRKAKLIAEQQLKNRPHGKYLRMLLPAKLYMSIRPQIIYSEGDDRAALHNGGSRGGFYYYYQFSNDLELMFHYEAGLDWNADTPFLNASDASNTNRRLSYFAFKYMDNSLILGKYWSAYYDVAGFTDQFMTYGAQASGAFSAGASGTGRADRMIQLRRETERYDTTLQVQLKHDALRDWNTNYSYTMAGSIIYKDWKDIKLGAAINYGNFDEITPEMRNVGIDGEDLSTVIGMIYKKENFSAHTTFSYMKNHTLDDQGIYFDSAGAELYLRYDIDEHLRVAGGGNWLFPTDDDYDGKYNIKNLIFSLQYTFGEKTFDDMVYMEVSLPNGKLADGESKDARIAIGLRYLLDY